MRESRSSVAQCFGAFATACAGITHRGLAASVAGRTALAVALTVLVVCAMHLPDPWWAAISAYVSVNPVSVPRAVRRTLGTVVGAGLGVVSAGWLAYDQAACCLALFAITFAGVCGFNTSRNGYGWLLGSVTFAMVVLASLSDPEAAVSVAVNRTIEVAVGTVLAVVTGLVAGTHAAPPSKSDPTRPDLPGRDLPVALHALHAGLTVALIPLLWSTFVLPGVSQMAITLVAVVATPVAPDGKETRRRVADRGVQRFLGCVAGGLPALALTGLGFESLLPWLLALACGVWLFAYVQQAGRDVAYLGTQAGVVFILTLVQGAGPPDSILPGIDRLTGILLGLAVLSVIRLIVGPPPSARAPA